MLIPILLVALVFLALSARLFRSAIAASGAEGWLGGFFLCVGISMPIRVLLTRDLFLPGDTETLVMMISHGLMTVGLTMYTLFVARVFRPDSHWAWATTACLIGLQILAPLAIIFFGGHRDEQHPVALLVGLIRALPFAWGFAESYRYYAQMRRRAALGLSDAVVTNRFALFSVWNGALFVLPIVLVILRTWAAVGIENGGMLSSGGTAQMILGLTRLALLTLAGLVVGALWLSFFPPKAWLERLRDIPTAATT